MNSTHRFALAAGLVVASGAVSVLAAPDLPEQMATHWNAAGVPDDTMSKPVALTLFPVLTAVLLGMFAVIPRIDPLGENIAGFRPIYDWFVVGFTAFMAVSSRSTSATSSTSCCWCWRLWPSSSISSASSSTT